MSTIRWHGPLGGRTMCYEYSSEVRNLERAASALDRCAERERARGDFAAAAYSRSLAAVEWERAARQREKELYEAWH